MFSVFISPHPGGGGGGVTHLCPIILPLVPCPFCGVPQSQTVGGGVVVPQSQARTGTSYAAGRTTLGFPQEDRLVFFKI